ncbi:[protein-PII] uridylyltransferase family protein [Nitrospira sp. Nam80]
MRKTLNKPIRSAPGSAPAKTARPRDPTPLLLAPGLSIQEVRRILLPYGVRSFEEADRNIQSMAGEPHERRQLATILADLLESTAGTADPDQALNHWERLFSGGVSRASTLDYLHASPRMLDLLCTIFGNSDALAFTLIRDPTLIHWLAEEDVLSSPPSRVGMEKALRATMGSLTVTELKLEALRRFRRREMLKIGVRDLFRLATVEETTASLSHLASVLIQAAYEIVDRDLRGEYGVPMHLNREGRWVEAEFAVIGMGKLGGHELNYSSDVDLIYVYSSEGHTRRKDHPERLKDSPGSGTITNEEYFELLARRLTKALSEPTKEGYLFRVDLRLRAEGSVGQLARSLDEYARYYRTRGRVWERLALLKSWPVAGSHALGKAFVRMTKRFVWNQGVLGMGDEQGALAIIRDVRAVKEMIDEKIADQGHERRNVKLGIGGIREIEFLAQTVQVIAGGRLSGIVSRNTLAALERLYQHGLLSQRELARLAEAYRFLRDVEHKLQMVHEIQTHSLPDDEEHLTQCAIRMGYDARNRRASLARFRADHARHTNHVNRTFRRFFYTPQQSGLLRATLSAIRRS